MLSRRDALKVGKPGPGLPRLLGKISSPICAESGRSAVNPNQAMDRVGRAGPGSAKSGAEGVLPERLTLETGKAVPVWEELRTGMIEPVSAKS